MEESVKRCCWRKEVNENLKRLHSLLFGAENCRDADSRSYFETDKAFIQHIRTQALSYPHTARKSLIPIVNWLIWVPSYGSHYKGIRAVLNCHDASQDFKNSLQEVRPSVSPNELGTFEQWNKQFGSLAK